MKNLTANVLIFLASLWVQSQAHAQGLPEISPESCPTGVPLCDQARAHDLRPALEQKIDAPAPKITSRNGPRVDASRPRPKSPGLVPLERDGQGRNSPLEAGLKSLRDEASGLSAMEFETDSIAASGSSPEKIRVLKHSLEPLECIDFWPKGFDAQGARPLDELGHSKSAASQNDLDVSLWLTRKCLDQAETQNYCQLHRVDECNPARTANEQAGYFCCVGSNLWKIEVETYEGKKVFRHMNSGTRVTESLGKLSPEQVPPLGRYGAGVGSTYGRCVGQWKLPSLDEDFGALERYGMRSVVPMARDISLITKDHYPGPWGGSFFLYLPATGQGIKDEKFTVGESYPNAFTHENVKFVCVSHYQEPRPLPISEQLLSYPECDPFTVKSSSVGYTCRAGQRLWREETEAEFGLRVHHLLARGSEPGMRVTVPLSLRELFHEGPTLDPISNFAVFGVTPDPAHLEDDLSQISSLCPKGFRIPTAYNTIPYIPEYRGTSDFTRLESAGLRQTAPGLTNRLFVSSTSMGSWWNVGNYDGNNGVIDGGTGGLYGYNQNVANVAYALMCVSPDGFVPGGLK